ncbi:MAG: hypothetical protein UR25_C0001G0102 [Candidatus Nomurabacteria bacterium GW2011_GWE1_32_28]|uniref:Uncharacterized protein n=1 Tax=Candidatus Nomurabacteria bacterium GW2011_GWF1_31_48 TaxID=1618767 RepID=A0A0F9YW45_9BACT|nr:MAG: hypothetical protein UR10_C0001G0055 [Candidatus Nomurabacteria bacterium GW2011_GWF2_30_133]KKP28933.1 MAG: hypothetical protein UR18_C0001G0054 [Candidatus Nomurabacteria bacterium GW2011_GWE2_31_40]KKP30671.1 MAG: hypothetical protein UR19_C0001G0055 [Candidatus Nomurabacteria bacterium GW2011_GWF1_31_48]KKP35189.1 MAG: hypothetical protein UR25_C0001G0102 [Candidatus Nomurabacteria bacterium GW2011_GWE1_32_28]HAS80499.1 hypothetical protein [Candidatus Nomurabacteria bacterium]
METKTCQNCKNEFILEKEDFNFYEKIKVPPPTWCPECRLIRRLAYREDRNLYKRICDNCNENIISIFRPDSSIKAYCPTCWYGDSWDGIEYGRDYDFSRSFFEQFHELQKIVPNQATGSKNSTDCSYSNNNIRCKNCTLTFDGFQSINCYNCQTPLFSRDSFDSDIVVNADHVYETLNSTGVYNTKFAYFSDECLDCSFIFNCIGCIDCFGCVNLRNQKYCIFNKKYTKEEYKKEIEKWDLGDYKILKKAEEKFLELYYKIPRRFSLITNSSNVIGDDIKNTKNCKTCFATRNGIENCKYIFLSGLLLKDSYDVTFGGDNSEIFYEKSGGMQSQKCMFSRACHHSNDVQYSDKIYNCSYIFGCSKLRNKKYCILNKQYTKEEYKELLPKIIKHMNDMPYVDKKERIYKYGEFFPTELSLFAYNETWAHKYFPLTKEEVLYEGFNWYDEKDRNYKITMKTENIPIHIKDVSDSILNQVIECEHNNKNCNQQCTGAFRILSNELQFYRQMNITLPRLCPSCRYGQRIKKKNPLRLWHRKCMCNGVQSSNKEYKNTIKHTHGDKPCQNEFETAIDPERKEIVYCEKCYQAEFV